MKVSKFVHSCLLIEEKDKAILIDPGNYTYQEQALNINTLEKLDYILITHEHPDHMYIPFIQELVKKFPHVLIITTSSAVEVLKKEKIPATTNGNEFITIESVPHERVFGVEVPQNVLFKLFDTFIHPGDSLHFNTHASILAIPIQAPWGSYVEAVEKGLKQEPHIIIPIHDWHWRDQAREALYQRARDYFKTHGIDFKGVEKGFVLEV